MLPILPVELTSTALATLVLLISVMAAVVNFLFVGRA